MSYTKQVLVVEMDRKTTATFNCPICKSNRWENYGESGRQFTCENKHTVMFDIYLSCNKTVNLALHLDY